MNRSQRRAAVARAKIGASAASTDIAALTAEADRAYREGRCERAEITCKQVLARNPAHAPALNLLGLMDHASGRHRQAVKRFADAIAADDRDALCHYNIAASYQALGQRTAAAAHFSKAIALGMGDEKDVEEFVMQNPAVVACVGRIVDRTNLPLKDAAVFAEADLAALANDVFLCCALEMTIIRGLTLEFLLTELRRALLSVAETDVAARLNEEEIGLFCALAQQCFNNEYVFAQGADETQRAGRLRDLLEQKATADADVSQLLLAAVAAYVPLHSLAAAKKLLAASWPPAAAALVRRQIGEPLEEREDRSAIPALTGVEDATSLQVQQQYEENPYPRWTIDRLAALTGDAKRQTGAAHAGVSGVVRDILIAGCGSGQHSIEMAQYFPEARILAIDISRTSLAYARRKTREQGLQNIEYAQADILQLAGLGRSFDRIDAVGVLHHLADPLAGWKILLSLLRPNGIMRVGLYSEAARRPVVDARALAAERGYGATAADIRALRQLIIRNRDDRRWNRLLTAGDFYSISGCRDLLFNVMEHRFDIPRIAAFLDENGLSFLGFELDKRDFEKFREQYPDVQALTDLRRWTVFEAANRQTFRRMYTFSVRKNAAR
jgi:SAM-dependent methyltransferase